MLILKRKRDEVTVITCSDGTEIRVRVVEVRGYSVRLGFDMPDDVTVDRLEIHEAKKNNPRSRGKEITSAEAEPDQVRAEEGAPSYHPRPGTGSR